MGISFLHYLALVAGLLLGGVITALTLLQRHNKKQTQLETAKNLIERDLAVRNHEILQLSLYKTEAIASREKIITLSSSQSEQDEKLKQLDETKEHIENLELKIDILREDNKNQTGKTAELREKLNHFDTLTENYQDLQHKYATLQDAASELRAEIAATATLLKKERDNYGEKLTLLNEAKEEMANRFKTVAQEIFEEKGTKFNTKQEKELGNLLDPLKEQLLSFNKRINDIHESSGKDQASLRQELETLRKSNMALNQEAKNLSQALKGDQKVQGNWGEMILEKVLEHSGLRKGIEYETQAGHRDDNHKLFKPDIIVHLPEGRDVIIDSKVSLVAYEESCNAEGHKGKQLALAAHVLSVRKHIKQLSDKDYSNLPGLNSPDFVLMFMPIEPAFMSAFQADDGLFQYGFERRIVVVTPSTLLATLRTIENIWRFERQNQNTSEIADRASKIYEKLRLYLESMDDLGKQLNKAQSTYHLAINRLSQGQGNLVNQAHELVKLGIKVKKEFPQNILGVSLDGEEVEEISKGH